MKRFLKLVTAFTVLFLATDSYAQNFTNRGKEFWVGYGHHQYMEPSCDGNNAAPNDMNMVLYLSAEQPATVTVTIDSSRKIPGFPNGWTRTYNIPANTVIQTENLPKGSTNAAASGSDANFDARLYDLPTPLGSGGEGIWRKKGIHIVSNVDIVAYAHIYGGVSSGATMLLPVQTWGYSYTSVNSEQRDADRSYSWMYIIAKDDNTRIRVTPTAASRNGRPSGTPFTVDLMKGQIYQYVAESQCSTGNGPELTGTKVKSIVGADGICHPIAMFSGSSRTGGETLTCGTGSGRDNDMQQGFPEHAWGKRYLTAPFSKASSGSSLQPASFQTSVYKIILKEPGTQVKKNGTTLSISGNIYTYSSSSADYIEANKPIMVAQYMSGTGTCNGGQGDPEMIYLSPIEQAIKNIGFYRNTKEAIVANYLTLVVPTAGLTSLRIDNSQLFSHTYPHPQNALLGTNYTVVVKGWQAEQAQCIVKCDSAFTAITYGLGGAESYGYNAGTYLKNLNAEGEIYNKPDTSNTARSFTCTGTPMEISALVSYQPTSMNWKLSALGSVVSPNTDVFVANPTPTGTVVIGSATYYRYKLPGTYIFNTAGSYDLPIVNTSTDIDNCSLQETVQIKIEVKQRPSSNFTYNHSGCRTDSVSFFGPNSTGTYTANGWSWNFGDATSSFLKDPKKAYGATGSYDVRLVVTSQEGCLSDTTKKTVVISPARPASIFISKTDSCQGASFTFSDTTTVSSGTFYWDFGVGAPVTLTSNTPQTVVYPAPGTYTVKHAMHPSGNCISDTVVRTITIYAKPVKALANSPVNYCQNGTAVPLTATALPNHTLTWYDNPALTGGSSTAPTPVTTAAGTFYYYVTQTNATGCISDTARIEVSVTPSITSNTIAASQTVCSGSPAALLTGSTPTGGTGNYTYQWQQSTDGGSTWTNISGATSIDYNPGTLSTGITFFRRVANSGLCTNNSNPITITVETNLSNYDIAASQTICEGTAPAQLMGQTPTGGTGSYSYQWQVSTDGSTWTNITGATLKDYQPGALNANTYFRRITSGGNCPAISSAVLITINPTANGNIVAPVTAICSYDSAVVNFTATAGTSPFNIQLQITAPGGGTSTISKAITGNGPVAITVIPVNSAGGTYSIALTSVSDNGACTRTNGLNSVTITVTQKPVLTVTPITPAVCKGDSISLSVSGATTYSWSPAAGLSATTGNTLYAKPTDTTTYTIRGTTNGCFADTMVTVIVNPLPAKPTAPSPIYYCQNDVATQLTATGAAGNTITWYNNPALNNGSTTAPTPNTAVAGTVFYYVTQTNATNCKSDTAKVAVTILPSLGNNTISADQTVCTGVAAAVLSGPAATGGDGTYNYQWQQSTDGGNTWNNINNATSTTYDPGVLGSGTIKFRRLVGSDLCNSISNIVTIIVETNLSNYDIAANQSICEGITPANLDGQTPTGGTGNYSFVWESSPDGSTWTIISGATGEDYQPGLLTASTYFRRKTSGGNCPAISNSVLITVNPTPNASISGPAGICAYEAGDISFTASKGTAPFTVSLLVTPPSGAPYTITQTVNSNGPVAIPVLPIGSAAGSYSIQLQSLSDNGNCTRTSLNTITIIVTATPVVTINPSSPNICLGKSTALVASGASTYSWSPSTGLSATSGSSVTANPIITTTYTVTGTTNGCTSTTNVTVTVNSLPVKPTVNTPVSYCQNTPATPLTATASAGNTLTWYTNAALTGGTTTAPTPATTTSGTVSYYVTQTNANGCVSEAEKIDVIVYPSITNNTIAASQTLCVGATPNDIAGSGTPGGGNGSFTYQWQLSTDGGITWNNIAGATLATYNPGSLANGTYSYRRMVTSTLCTNVSNIVTIIFETNLSNYNIAADQSICEGITPTIIDGQTPTGGTGNYTFVWESSPDGSTWTIINGATGEDYQPGLLTASTYFRRKSSGGNCPAISNTVLITVNPTPNGTITGPAGICEYEAGNISFTATKGTAPFSIQLQVTAPGGGTSTITQTVNSNGPVFITVIPANSVPGTYIIALTNISDNSGCPRTTGMNTITIVVTAKPVLTLTPSSLHCAGSGGTPLTVSGATTYSWSPATGLSSTTGSTVTANPATTTTYTVTGTTNGCTSTADVTVTVVPRPAKPAVTTPVVYCQEQTAIALNATATGGHTLTWYDNAALTGGSNTAPTPSTAIAGTFYYYVTQTNSNNCVSDTARIEIAVRPNPKADFRVPQNVCAPDGSATFINNTTISDNTSLQYQWNFGDNTPVSYDKNPTHIYATAGSYYVNLIVTSPYGCVKDTTILMNSFIDRPVANFNVVPDTLCQGSDNVFTDLSTPVGTLNKWSWDFGDGSSPSASANPTHRYNRPGNFPVKLVVTNTAGCTSLPYVKDVIVYLQPVIDAGPNFVVTAGTKVQFKASANDTANLRFVWTPGGDLSNPNILQPQLVVTKNQRYTLVATGSGGCTAVDTMTVRVLQPIIIPNAFSPNGDGTNDKWMIPNLLDYPGARVEIFNRWGQQVFLSFGYNKPWDGTYMGKPLPLATYYYIITLGSGFAPVTGSITIIK